MQKNLISISFTDPELQQVDQALGTLETVFSGKLIQLKGDESKKYGKIGPSTGDWVKKVHDDTITMPALAPAFIDVAEWNKDETAREALLPRLSRLLSLTNNMEDTCQLLGFDVYSTCLSVYNNVHFLMSQNIPGSAEYFAKWSEHFAQHAAAKPVEKSTDKK